MNNENIQNLFEPIFKKWYEQNNISSEQIETTLFLEKIPYFSSMQEWRTATKDDYFKERNVSEHINKEELKDYMEDLWGKEIAPFAYTEMEGDHNFIYSESASLFDHAFANYCKNKKEQMERNCYEIC